MKCNASECVCVAHHAVSEYWARFPFSFRERKTITRWVQHSRSLANVATDVLKGALFLPIDGEFAASILASFMVWRGNVIMQSEN